MDKRNWTKLGSIPIGDGREAALWRDEQGKTRQTSGVGPRWILRSGADTDPFVTTVPDGTLVFGTLLPGATRVEVRAPVEPRDVLAAGGEYLALLPGTLTNHNVFVLHRDDDGNIVPPALPELLKREPLSDADTPCPACGGRDWDVVERRAEPEEDFTRWAATVCRTCGRYEGWTDAGHRRPGRGEPDFEDEFSHSSGLSDDPTPAAVARAAPFDIYTLGSEIPSEAKMDSWGWQGDDILRICVLHRHRVGRRKAETTVTTEILAGQDRRDARLRAISQLRSNLRREAWRATRERKLSSEARDLLRSEQDRVAGARAEEATIEELELEVDGNSRPFTVARDVEGSWVAVSLHNGTAVTVEGRELAPGALQLATVIDPDAFFAA